MEQSPHDLVVDLSRRAAHPAAALGRDPVTSGGAGAGPAVRRHGRVLAVGAAAWWFVTALTVAAAEPTPVFTPDAAPPGTLIHATNLAAVCGEITPGSDFVQLYRSEGTNTGDDVVFEPGSFVEHDRPVISYSAPDGDFVVPDVAPATYVVYLICYERDLVQLVGASLTVLPRGPTVPGTDTASEPVPASESAVGLAILVAVTAVVIGLLGVRRAGRRHSGTGRG
jgi:hypothetical protein